MQATINIRVPHVRDGLIVANVGGVTNGPTSVGGATNVNRTATPLWETR
jgi:hypothetical protein